MTTLNKQLVLNTNPTSNGRTYPLNVLESIKKQIEDNSVNLGTTGYGEGIILELDEVSFSYSNPIIENNSLYIDVKPATNSLGNCLVENINEYVFRTKGIVNLSSEFIVDSGYKLLYIAAVPKSGDALNLN